VIYIDTGAFVARYLGRDQFHDQAIAFWDEIRHKGESCFTSNFVLDECFTLLGRRAGYKFAVQRARNLYASKLLIILRPARREEMAAIDFFEKFADKGVSFTDCISFVLMRREKIKRAFTFDNDFQWAGFQLCPSDAY
jgi:predicted nucleic acid-binding protein